MPGPKPPAITLTDGEGQHLELVTRRRRAPQHLALRARIILTAADGLNNAHSARQHAGTVDTS